MDTDIGRDFAEPTANITKWQDSDTKFTDDCVSKRHQPAASSFGLNSQNSSISGSVMPNNYQNSTVEDNAEQTGSKFVNIKQSDTNSNLVIEPNKCNYSHLEDGLNTDHIEAEKDDLNTDHIEAEKDDLNTDHIEAEKDDLNTDHIEAEKDDLNTDHVEAKKDDFDIDRIIVEKHKCFAISTRNKERYSKWLHWCEKVSLVIRQLLSEVHGGIWQTRILHVEHVKSYAPHVDHIVLDLKCMPVSEDNITDCKT